ncbi:MAG: hypothetical protein QW767_05635 [Thermoprotei archaeon]
MRQMHFGINVSTNQGSKTDVAKVLRSALRRSKMKNGIAHLWVMAENAGFIKTGSPLAVASNIKEASRSELQQYRALPFFSEKLVTGKIPLVLFELEPGKHRRVIRIVLIGE